MLKRAIIFLMSLFLFFSVSFGNFTISPLKFEIQADPGQTVRKTLKITNNGSETVTLYGSKENFVAGDNTGTPKFVEK